MTVSKFCRSKGIGRNRFYIFLRTMNVIDDENIPLRVYKEYFSVRGSIAYPGNVYDLSRSGELLFNNLIKSSDDREYINSLKRVDDPYYRSKDSTHNLI